ncbi:MAG: hypothetical protein WC475_02105 [Candidatus Paceibacterota bacterium]
MWKRIVIYIIILIILLALYFFFTPQSLKANPKESSSPIPENQNKTSSFKGPGGMPSVKGPTEAPPSN